MFHEIEYWGPSNPCPIESILMVMGTDKFELILGLILLLPVPCAVKVVEYCVLYADVSCMRAKLHNNGRSQRYMICSSKPCISCHSSIILSFVPSISGLTYLTLLSSIPSRASR